MLTGDMIPGGRWSDDDIGVERGNFLGKVLSSSWV